MQNRRLKNEAVTKTEDYLIICEYKTEELKNIEISTPISLKD